MRSLIIGLAALCAICSPLIANAEIPKEAKFHADNGRDRDFVEALHSVLPHALDMLDAPGLQIAVARNGRIIFEGAYGYADVHARQPMRTSTVFRSGSMGKTYTGTAIMQLVEQGVISLEDPINEHLSFEVENPLGGEEITIYHLLTHSSGLNFDGAGSLFEPSDSLIDLVKTEVTSETQNIMGGLPTWAYKTGEQRRYSNIGISILGLIIQNSNPESLTYSEYIEQNIMAPLGMESSQYPPLQREDYVRPDLWARMSKGYNTSGGIWIENLPTYIESYPAGGFVSTPADHARLLMAFLNQGTFGGAKILEPTTVEKMLTVSGTSPHPGLPSSKLGLIWFLTDWEQDKTKKFHHGGGHTFGWRTQAMAWPSHDTVVVYAVNEWSSATAKDYYGLIDGIVETLLVSSPAAPPSRSLEGIENLAWKASYLRGLMFVEAYRYSIGTDNPVNLEEAARVTSQATPVLWSDDVVLDWDETAFLEGVTDMAAVDNTTSAYHAFAHSEKMRISLDEAKLIAPWIGAENPETGLIQPAFASLAGILSTTD